MDKNKKNDKEPYNYTDSGFSSFFRRSIDNPDILVSNLQGYARLASQQTRAINFDQQPVSGSVGDIMRVGTIELDGSKGSGRITIYDGVDAMVRLGDLDE